MNRRRDADSFSCKKKGGTLPQTLSRNDGWETMGDLIGWVAPKNHVCQELPWQNSKQNKSLKEALVCLLVIHKGFIGNVGLDWAHVRPTLWPSHHRPLFLSVSEVLSLPLSLPSSHSLSLSFSLSLSLSFSLCFALSFFKSLTPHYPIMLYLSFRVSTMYQSVLRFLFTCCWT